MKGSLLMRWDHRRDRRAALLLAQTSFLWATPDRSDGNLRIVSLLRESMVRTGG